MDSLTKEQRSELMAKVKSKNTKPELIVRSITHRMGFRYRLHDKKLPGKPDMVFKKSKKVILINGCFWHRHIGCSRCRMPKSRRSFWKEKFKRNIARDEITKKRISDLGWNYLIIWECELENISALSDKIRTFLES